VNKMVEPQPTPYLKQSDPQFYDRLLRQPLFLCMLATKTGRPRNRSIRVVTHDAKWAQQFKDIRDALVKHLHPLIVAIEHVGSTSVPGLAAKPILDIDVVISERDDLAETVKTLSKLGYFHQGDKGIAGRESFSNQDGQVPWDGSGRTWPTHYLYVCDHTNRELIRHLAFRDYLRQHPEEVRQYSQVKITAASRHPHDIDGYMAEKAECVERIIEKAKVLEGEIARQLETLTAARQRR
jgi:GrpB-like predicted nucleotidyltransferase (UPF0157 family)